MNCMSGDDLELGFFFSTKVAPNCTSHPRGMLLFVFCVLPTLLKRHLWEWL